MPSAGAHDFTLAALTPRAPLRPPPQAGEIHNFCHPNSLLTLQEYLNDYGDTEAKKLGAEVRPLLRRRRLDASGWGAAGGGLFGRSALGARAQCRAKGLAACRQCAAPPPLVPR